MLTRITETPAVVTQDKTLNLPPPNAMGISLSPASATNKGGYPLKVFINGKTDSPKFITGPGTYTHEEVITRIEVDVGPGGGMAGDVWNLDVEQGTGRVQPMPMMDEHGRLFFRKPPPRPLFSKTFHFDTEPTFGVEGKVMRVYLNKATGGFTSAADDGLTEVEEPEQLVWDLRDFRAVTFSYEANFKIVDPNLQYLECFAELAFNDGGRTVYATIPMGSVNNFASTTGFEPRVAGLITIDSDGRDVLAPLQNRVSDRLLFAAFFVRYEATGPVAWGSGGYATSAVPTIELVGHY